MKPAPATGLYPDMPEGDYFDMEAVNASLLKVLAAKTPMHARYDQSTPREPTPAMLLGSAAHAVMLQPHLFESQYARGLTDEDGRKLPRRSNAQKAAHAAHEAENEGKVILDADQYDDLFVWRDRVMRHPLAKELLEATKAVELTVVWRDEETGLACKARLDALSEYRGRTVIVDLKTTGDASTFPFARSCAKFHYHIQAAHYLNGLAALAGDAERHFLFIAIEKEPPYPVQVFELGKESLESGRAICRRELRRWAECVRTDHYPGYISGINTIELPEWALDFNEEEPF